MATQLTISGNSNCVIQILAFTVSLGKVKGYRVMHGTLSLPYLLLYPHHNYLLLPLPNDNLPIYPIIYPFDHHKS